MISLVGKVVKTTDAKGNAIYVLDDKFDRQIATYDAIKHQTSASKYDAVDRVTESTDTFGQTTRYTYNTALNNKVTVDPFLGTTTELFDTAGNLIQVTDPLNRSTYYTYDKRNRQIKIKDANNGETNYSYFKDGQTASIKDAVGNTTKYTYDVAGRLIREQLTDVSQNDLGSRFYSYDLVNNRIQGTDRNERITNYGYDHLNRVKSEEWFNGGKTFSYSYDKNGNRLTADDGNIRYEYGYDNTDLLETVDRISDANPNDKLTFQYTYDEIGNLTRTEEKVGASVNATTIYEYDDPRYLNTKITQFGAGLANKKVEFTYDSTGSNTKIERYLDQVLKVSTTNAYDPHGRLTGIAQVKGITPTNPTGTPISDDAYVLDNLNRLQTQTKGGQVKEIGYDKTDQVQTVTGGAGEAYTYDKNGNRTGGGYTTGVDNRLTSDGTYSYQYDPEGNRKSRTNIVTQAVDEYAWDYRNRLTGIVSKTSSTGTITQTVSYEYDVDDQRVSKTVTSTTLNAGTSATGSTTEKYYLDGNQIAFVTDGSGNRTEHYLYGLNVDQVMAQDSPAGMVWALADTVRSLIWEEKKELKL
jgi:YD repeat-containing protein